jgi:hypothetical protein
VDYPKELRSKERRRIRFQKCKTALGPVEKENQLYLRCFYTDYDGVKPTKIEELSDDQHLQMLLSE